MLGFAAFPSIAAIVPVALSALYFYVLFALFEGNDMSCSWLEWLLLCCGPPIRIPVAAAVLLSALRWDVYIGALAGTLALGVVALVMTEDH